MPKKPTIKKSSEQMTPRDDADAIQDDTDIESDDEEEAATA